MNSDEIEKSIIHYYKCFNNEFRKFILDSFPNLDLDKVLNKYDLMLDNFEDNNAYVIQDTENYILILIKHFKNTPEEVNYTILDRIDTDDAKTALMVYLNNSYKTIKLLIKELSDVNPEINLEGFEEGSVYLKDKNSNNYLGFVVSFKPSSEIV